MTVVKIEKGVAQYIEHNLYHYFEYVRDIQRLKKDILFGRANYDENVGGGRGNLPSRPTERRTIELITHRRLERLEQIVHAIQTVYQSLTPEKRKAVQLKYWSGKSYTWEQVAREIGVSVRQLYRWRDKIIYDIAKLLGETGA